ncbi:MAG: endonuclease domain-containing protein [Devosia sp.]
MSIERARALRKRMPPMESKLWNALRGLKPLGFHFRRQVPIGPYYVDFASHEHRLAIEVDGESHFADGGQDYDVKRAAFIRGEGYRVFRVTNVDVAGNLEGVLTLIVARAQAPEHLATPTLNPSPQGGGRRRNRRIVELGHRTLADLPPPQGTDQ